ncbi:hypothetical protein [Spirosoma validum]|uniref:hypothetical protein n=1 Tax=Spirosoma validum TaxID=2771355 RepID=UPI001CC2BEE7|nr:hypothetical protein [Spirosoma validum]
MRSFLNRPLAENFYARTQFRLALQSGLYVFLLAGLLNGAYQGGERLAAVAGLSLGCVATVVFANSVLPRLLPVIYDEDRCTLGRHIVHTLVVLLLITSCNELTLDVLGMTRPFVWQNVPDRDQYWFIPDNAGGVCGRTTAAETPSGPGPGAQSATRLASSRSGCPAQPVTQC